jgi:cyclase
MMKKSAKLIFVVLSSLMALGIGFAQMQSTAITSEKITDHIYIVKGGMANTAFIAGDKEAVAIDAEMTAEQGQQMIAEIKKATPKPLTKIILTHSDADHVNGIAGFPRGLEIISSDVAKKEMEEASKAPNGQALAPYLPTKTFAEKMDLEIAPERIQLLHFGPAHTSGDTVVYFPARKLAFVGDLVFIGRDPLIHRIKGGSSTGLIKTLQALLKLDAEKFVPGHGNIVGKSDIEGELKTLQEKQDKVKSLIKQGKSLDEIKTAFGIPVAPAKPGGMSFPSVVEIMYQEFSGK